MNAPLHVCARRLDSACIARELDAGADVDVVDADGKTPLLLAVEAAMLARQGAGGAAVDAVGLLFQRGANEDLLAVQAFLSQQTRHPASAPLQAALSNPHSVDLWRKARDDARVRAELDLSREEFQRARDNLEALRRSGRFVDLYVAYGVSRSVEDIKRAQALASSREEYQALEHMAVLTLLDPSEVVQPSISIERDRLRQFSVNGIAYSALADVSADNDLAFLIKLRQTPDSRIHLRFASYLATVDLVVAMYAKTADGVDPLRVIPVIIPVNIRIAPTNYIGAGILRLSDFKAAMQQKAAVLGGYLAFARTAQIRLIRLERIE